MAVKASGANVNLRLRGTAGDGETDINEEINGESTDANANVSLATLSTGVGFDTADGGHKMSEFFGYSGSVDVEWLVVAGGGGGGCCSGPGGGAGGLRTSFGTTSGGGASAESNFVATSGTSYTVTVGAGGSPIWYLNSPRTLNYGSRGGNSIFHNITSKGGGVGYRSDDHVDGDGVFLSHGGSGSGGSYSLADINGLGTAGQGYDGGNNGTAYNPSGGGGAGGAGGLGGSSAAGNGGAGLAVNIISTTNAATAGVGEVSGSDVYFASGGGGGGDSYRGDGGGTASVGGGGSGGYTSTNCTLAKGVSGDDNTGGGGGAGANRPYTGCNYGFGAEFMARGGIGGSGVVILRYPSSNTLTVGAGLTQASGSPFTEGSYKVSVFTGGTGTVNW